VDRIIIDPNHLLFKYKSKTYFDKLLSTIQNISLKTNNRIKEESILKNKLWIDRPISFEQNEKLTQNIVEIIISNYFCMLLDEIEYEPNKKSKSPELIGLFQETQIQVEVKCPSYIKNEVSENHFIIKTLGRDKRNFLFYDEISSFFNSLNNQSSLYKNNDNKVKDYLCDAHKKFEREYKKDSINILIIVLDDIQLINEYFLYFRFTEGAFFTKNPCLLNPEYFKNVDYVVLSSLRYFHNFNYEVDSEIQWTFDKQFNIILENPFRRNNKNLNSLLSFDLSNLFYEYEFEAEDTNVASALALRIFYEKKISSKDKILYFPNRSVKNITDI
jgi:hypothetical protein